MGRHYNQLGLEERCSIARLHEGGQSIRQIATALDRTPSSISRELKRNTGKKLGYSPAYAQDQARARRWSGARLERNDALRDIVLDRLARGWSPEQVAGRLARERGTPVISHESIYRFIYAQIRRTNDGAWRHYLPRAKARRGWRGKSGGSPVSFIQHRVPIAERPESANNRALPGHWEADLMAFATYGQNILAAHDRTTRYTFIARQHTKQAEPTARQLIAWLKTLPRPMRQSVTFDNGTEFAKHHQLGSALQTQTYFCNTHSPWQKGGVENAIGRLRKTLPRKTNLDTLSPEDIQACANRYNHTPRKCLDFLSPAEAFHNQLLHFKCESTSPPPPGRRCLASPPPPPPRRNRRLGLGEVVAR
jgi:IS30 family transposase